MLADAGTEWKERTLAGGIGGIFLQGNRDGAPEPDDDDP
jgi:hypothetical protein